MFTGIVEAVGRIAALERRGNDARLRIDAGRLDMTDVKPGDSIAASGVCLTVIELSGKTYSVDVSGETLARTTLGEWTIGTEVNLEKALLPTTRLGGHLVSGHVDGVGTLRSRSEDGRSIQLRIEAPRELAKYIAEKGSICVDGVSLTVNGVNGATFDLTIIPHTAAQTILGGYEAGRRVNLEVDLLARYMERLLAGEAAADPVSDALARRGQLK